MISQKKQVTPALLLTLSAIAFYSCQHSQTTTTSVAPAEQSAPAKPAIPTEAPPTLEASTSLEAEKPEEQAKAEAPARSDKKVIAQNEQVDILYQKIKSGEQDFDEPIAAVWIRDKKTQKETKLYQTVEPSGYSWYEPDGKKFYPIPIDSLIATSKISIYNNEPLQIIAEGTINLRNVYSYFIDVPRRKAWLVPANGGYVGRTAEEDYMIFQSYRYCSDPDILGRYTFLQFFNEKGIMVGAYSFERQHIQKYKSLAKETNP